MLVCVEGIDVFVKLLCNHAVAAKTDENYVSALTNATALLVLDPSYVKAWYRCASALRKLNKNKAGLVACKQATKLLKAHSKDNMAFKSLVKAMTEAEAAPHQTSPKISTEEQKRMLKEVHDVVTKKDYMGTQQLSMLNLMINLIHEEEQIKLFAH